MKIIKNNYFLKGNVKKNIKIALISDIHYSRVLNIDSLYNINDYIKGLDVDYICIPGDIIDNNKYLGNEKRDLEFLNWIESLGSITKTIISIGNHDIIVNKDYSRSWNDLFFNRMSSLKNVVVLDNDIFEDDRVRFLGYTSVYDHGDKLKRVDLYVNDYKRVFGEIKKDKYNVLMCHSPKMLVKDEIYTKIELSKSIDLVLCGHMHNGMYLPFMEKMSHSNRGLISPYKRPFPKFARGHVHKNYDTYSVDFIISGGVTKLSQESSRIFYTFNFIYPPHVEIISIEGESNG